MKKTLIIVAATLLGMAATAQTTFDADGLRYWRQTHQQRDASRMHLNSQIPLAAKVATRPATKSSWNMPTERVWFPGEWEEVQAVTVTPYYVYVAKEHTNWIADPVVPGYADYYSSYYSQSPSGHGEYLSIMDTNNESGIGDVSFYLMDAIQMGGAQAWVRVEQEGDTAVVLRKLARMGLRNNNVRFLIAPGNSFWFRDCGPICFYYGDEDNVAMLDFEYYPGRALDDSLPVYIERQFGLPNYTTCIEWEGGNCVVDGAGMLLSSDQVYGNNMDAYGQIVWDGVNYNSIDYSRKTPLTRAQVKSTLQSLLGQRATHILPAYQYDGGTGHVDLYADMIDENTFVFSRMPHAYYSWLDYGTGLRNMDSLCSYRSIFDARYTSRSIPFPSKDNGSNFANQQDYTNYTRTYSNHTFVNNVIIQPCFSSVGSDGMPTASWDRANIEEIKKAYPGYTIYCVDVRSFDGSGGAIHCITKQIPAENPVRILHHSISGCANGFADAANTSVPVSAIITNRNGVDHAEAVYRVNGGAWQTISLTANGNRFYGQIPSPVLGAPTFDTTIVADTAYAGFVTDSIVAIDTTYDADGETILSIDTTYFTGVDTTISFDTTITTIVDTNLVEYYISATANGGKTMTKPITASQGGYYSYYFTSKTDTVAQLDSSLYDFSTEPMPAEDITFSMQNGPGVGIAPVAQNNDSRFGQFYPNPATEQANLDIDLGNGQSYTVYIYDINGRTVHTSGLNADGAIVYSINTSRLAAGIYTVVFSNGNDRVTRKLIVK